VPIVRAVSNLVRFRSLVRSVGLQGYLSLTADRIYALPEMSEKDGVKVAELEMEFAEMDGYMAESS
jgi:hypothetical protein